MGSQTSSARCTSHVAPRRLAEGPERVPHVCSACCYAPCVYAHAMRTRGAFRNRMQVVNLQRSLHQAYVLTPGAAHGASVPAGLGLPTASPTQCLPPPTGNRRASRGVEHAQTQLSTRPHSRSEGSVACGPADGGATSTSINGFIKSLISCFLLLIYEF